MAQTHKTYPHGRCHARSQTTGDQCRQDCQPGRQVCRYHGGTARRGIAHPGYKHGQYVQSLPPYLRERVTETASDPELLVLRTDIALSVLRIGQLAHRLSNPERTPGQDGTSTWQHIRSLATSVRQAMTNLQEPTAQNTATREDTPDAIFWHNSACAKDGDRIPDAGSGGLGEGAGTHTHTAQQPSASRHTDKDMAEPASGTKGAGFRESLDALLGAIEAGSADDEVWELLRTETAHREKLVASERKRLVELSQMMTAEQALVLLDRIAHVIRQHVTDRAALVAISTELNRLAALPGKRETTADA